MLGKVKNLGNGPDEIIFILFILTFNDGSLSVKDFSFFGWPSFASCNGSFELVPT